VGFIGGFGGVFAGYEMCEFVCWNRY